MKKAIFSPPRLEFFLKSLRDDFGNFIVLRGYDLLPKAYSNDIDVYIPKTELPRFFRAINNMKNIDTSIKILVSRLGLIKCELIIDDDKVSFDILYGFYYFGLEYQDLNLLSLNAMIHKSGIFSVPDISDEVRISLLKELLHNGRVRSDKSLYLLEMLIKCIDTLPTKYFTVDTLNEIKKSIIDGNLELPKLSLILKLRLLCFNLFQSPLKTIHNIAIFIVIKYLLGNSYHNFITK